MQTLFGQTNEVFVIISAVAWSEYHNYRGAAERRVWGKREPSTASHRCACQGNTHTHPTSFHLNIWIKDKRRNVETGSRDHATETEMC